jgi:hypothetical protein
MSTLDPSGVSIYRTYHKEITIVQSQTGTVWLHYRSETHPASPKRVLRSFRALDVHPCSFSVCEDRLAITRVLFCSGRSIFLCSVSQVIMLQSDINHSKIYFLSYESQISHTQIS